MFKQLLVAGLAIEYLIMARFSFISFQTIFVSGLAIYVIINRRSILFGDSISKFIRRTAFRDYF